MGCGITNLTWQWRQGIWWLVDSATNIKVETVAYDEARGIYVDSKGISLGKVFDGARDMVEKRFNETRRGGGNKK